jgi:hypothetical protein
MDLPPYTQDATEATSDKQKKTLQQKARITIPPCRIRTVMKTTYKRPVSEKATVYAAAASEFLLKVILKGAAKTSKKKKSKKDGKHYNIIGIRQLLSSLKENEPVSGFLESSNALLVAPSVRTDATEKKKGDKVKKE